MLKNTHAAPSTHTDMQSSKAEEFGGKLGLSNRVKEVDRGDAG